MYFEDVQEKWPGLYFKCNYNIKLTLQTFSLPVGSRSLSSHILNFAFDMGFSIKLIPTNTF